MTADYRCKTRNPEDPDGPLVDVFFPGDLTSRLYKYASVRYQNLIAAKAILENTRRIFRGVREYNQGGWCYTGQPQSWFIREDVEVPFPPDKVFAVYVNPQMRVYECRAEFCADDDELCPVDWRDRYGALIWKSTS